MTKLEQYRGKAAGWSTREYADSATYLGRRAELVVSLGPPLQRGDEVLDLACGDGGLGAHLVRRGIRYRGVDVTPEMIGAAQALAGAGAVFEVGDLNEYLPPTSVAATTLFRALYYADDRRALFRRVAEFTTRKIVFDLNPRQYRVEDVVADLRAGGFERVQLRPFFVPQRVALPSVAWLLRAAERGGPVARLALRVRFTYVVAAWNDRQRLERGEAEVDARAERSAV